MKTDQVLVTRQVSLHPPHVAFRVPTQPCQTSLCGCSRSETGLLLTDQKWAEKEQQIEAGRPTATSAEKPSPGRYQRRRIGSYGPDLRAACPALLACLHGRRPAPCPRQTGETKPATPRDARTCQDEVDDDEESSTSPTPETLDPAVSERDRRTGRALTKDGIERASCR